MDYLQNFQSVMDYLQNHDRDRKMLSFYNYYFEFQEFLKAEGK